MRAWCMVLLLACGGEERVEPAPQPQPEPPPSTHSQGEQTPVVPATIRVINDTEETLMLDRSFGPASPLGVVALGPGTELPLSLDQSDAGADWVSTCECECNATSCPECEPPEVVHETLAPGDAYTFEWSGRLRRRRAHRNGGACWTTILAQPGDYVFTACTEDGGVSRVDGHCGRAEVTLPTSTIEIRLSNRANVESCDDFDASRSWVIRGRAVDQLGFALRDRPLNECNRVACVAPDRLDAELQSAREHPCTVFIVPRGHEVEARVFLPLPEGTLGGESYSHYFDADLTRLLRARYEQ